MVLVGIKIMGEKNPEIQALEWNTRASPDPRVLVEALKALDRLVEKIPFDPDNEMVPRAVGLGESFQDYIKVKAALSYETRTNENGVGP